MYGYGAAEATAGRDEAQEARGWKCLVGVGVRRSAVAVAAAVAVAGAGQGAGTVAADAIGRSVSRKQAGEERESSGVRVRVRVVGRLNERSSVPWSAPALPCTAGAVCRCRAGAGPWPCHVGNVCPASQRCLPGPASPCTTRGVERRREARRVLRRGQADACGGGGLGAGAAPEYAGVTHRRSSPSSPSRAVTVPRASRGFRWVGAGVGAADPMPQWPISPICAVT